MLVLLSCLADAAVWEGKKIRSVQSGSASIVNGQSHFVVVLLGPTRGKSISKENDDWNCSLFRLNRRKWCKHT